MHTTSGAVMSEVATRKVQGRVVPTHQQEGQRNKGEAKRNTQWDANTKFKSWSTQGWQTTGTSINIVLVIIGFVHIHMQSHLLTRQLFNSSVKYTFVSFTFSHWCNWGFLSSGMWHYIAGWVVPDISDDCSAFNRSGTTHLLMQHHITEYHNPQYFMYPGPTTTTYAYQNKDSYKKHNTALPCWLF